MEENLKELRKLCKKYGYTVQERFGDIYIKTRFEEWYFTPYLSVNAKEKRMICLHHKNSMSYLKARYHHQFTKELNYQQLVRYLWEHENAKFTHRHVKFSVVA